MPIEFSFGNNIDLDKTIELYRESTLGERRPIDDRSIVKDMLEHANLVVTAWDGDRLVGLSRSLTDFGFVAYLADLAVHVDYQKQGIGKRLIGLTRERLGPRAKIVLLAAPAAADYYEKIGFSHNPRAWVLTTVDDFDY
jgi:predicted N-acetyltransferase YhbS